MRVFVLLCAAFFALHIATANPVLDVNQESPQLVQLNHTHESPGQHPCPPGFSPRWGRCFAFFPNPMTWIDAEEHCSLLYGANLASIHNQEESEFLNKLMKQSDYYGPAWIGANDAVEFGKCLWSDGSPFEDRFCILPKSWFRWRRCFSIDSHDFHTFVRRDCKDELPFFCGTRPWC